ncbi:MAG TPA: aminomethyltransferase beta-barrel domain-containing protein, partial [Chitinophagaceae bacterium]|nr:aminomethyltransferase beta-barrel domain-containing protein [Chitinophagaceae bacterium]
YVTAINPENNSVVLGDEEDLDRDEMMVGKINMLKYETITPGMEAHTKIRYKSEGSLSNLYPGNGSVNVRFFEHVKSIAPGQSAVFYEGDDVIGGGIIMHGNQAGNKKA